MKLQKKSFVTAQPIDYSRQNHHMIFETKLNLSKRPNNDGSLRCDLINENGWLCIQFNETMQIELHKLSVWLAYSESKQFVEWAHALCAAHVHVNCERII